MNKSNVDSDAEIREQMLSAMDALFSGRSNPELLSAFRKEFPSSKTALVFHWIPEQGENIFYVITDDVTVAMFEISRVPPVGALLDFQKFTLSDYEKKHRLSDFTRRKLKIAVDLVAEEKTTVRRE
jgi:hypothetical protein